MNKKYDLAISFAGEDRIVAKEIADILSTKGISVFYDNYENAELWGKDLYEHLIEVYKNSSKYCLMLLSDSYQKKLWTTHERKAAQARAFKDSSEYILPIRIDDTEIPGVLETVGYIDIRKTSIQDVCNIIEIKLWGNFKNDKGIATLKEKLKEVYDGTMLICDYSLAPQSQESDYKLNIAPQIYRTVVDKFLRCKEYCLLNNKNFDPLILGSLTNFLEDTEHLLKISAFLLERTDTNHKNTDFIFELPEKELNRVYEFLSKIISQNSYPASSVKFYKPIEIIESWKSAEKTLSQISISPGNYKSKPDRSIYVFNTKAMSKMSLAVGEKIRAYTH